MKKIYFGMIAAAALMTACDPATDDISWSGETISKDVLENGITLEQFDYNEETGAYTPAADGNYIKFATNPSKVVEIYYLVEGSEVTLSSGKANGIFPLSPMRGSDPNQTVYFRTREFDGSSVTAEKHVTVKVATELPLEMSIICSNAGQKIWKWNADGREFWGNYGYTPGTGEGVADNLDGKWWGITSTEGFADQQQHRGGDGVKGDDDTNAYMIFSEAGTVQSFDATGKEIRKSKFQINDYDPVNRKVVNDQPWHVGTLQIKGDDGGILWPYAINTGGMMPSEYQILKLTATDLVLTYAAPGTGSWSEATFWRFTSDSDNEGIVAGYSKEGQTWTWDKEIGVYWGNAGYQAGGSWAEGNDGQWWGVDGAGQTFADQQGHRGGDKVTGDDDNDAYMIFSPDGNIKSFDAAGNEIRSGKFNFGQATVNGQDRTCLYTTAGSILWPYAINTGGYMPEQFEVMYLTGSKMALVYAAEGTGAWSECTFWRFEKK